MAKSVKVNFAYNLINSISGLLFPLVTFPYASRILLADGIGQVNFYLSIINYVTLFTSIGIPLYATREVARVRNDNIKVSITTIEILLLHLVLTILGYFVVFMMSLSIEKVQENLSLFLILSGSIVFTTIGCEWFYKGIEDFRYITIRNICFKILCAFSLFVLVKSKEDLLTYGILSILGTVGNNVFNFLRLKKYVPFSYIFLKEISPLRHLKPSLHIFVLNLAVSIYVNLDPIMLGFMKDAASVGYYTAATKISHVFLGITSALQAAMLPRLSNLYHQKDYEQFYLLAQKAIDFVFFLCTPLFLGLIVLSPALIVLFCGDTYIPSIMTLQLISPVILFIALSGVIGIQILYPQGKENIVICSTILGAIVNLLLNFILIPIYAHDGAAVSTAIAEFSVTASVFVFGYKYLHIKSLSLHYANCIIGGFVMFLVCIFVRKLDLGFYHEIILIPLVGGLSYLAYLYVMRDSFLKYCYNMIRLNKH